jgi:hypothetical protein
VGGARGYARRVFTFLQGHLRERTSRSTNGRPKGDIADNSQEKDEGAVDLLQNAPDTVQIVLNHIYSGLYDDP